MKEFKYFIQKLNDAFSPDLSFIKTKNKFNKIHGEFLEIQIKTNETYNLLFPLERIFL